MLTVLKLLCFRGAEIRCLTIEQPMTRLAKGRGGSPAEAFKASKATKATKAMLRLSRETRHLLNFQAILLGTSYERSGYAECL